MPTPLIITEEVRENARKAVAHAEANTVSIETMRALAAGEALPRGMFLEFEVPVKFRVVFTHEVHPGGLMRHMSMSSPIPGRLPHPVGLQEVMRLLGFKRPLNNAYHVWPEQIGPNHEAINVIEPIGEEG